MRPCGHLADPPELARGDELGYLLGASRDTLPDAWDLSRYASAGYDQRGNSCVGAAFRHALMLEAAVRGYALDPSATSTYALARQVVRPAARTLADIGCHPYAALSALTDWGVVARVRYNDDVDLTVPVPPDVLEAGSLALLTGAYRIYEDGVDRLTRIREAVHGLHGVFFGMPIGPRYMASPGELYAGETHEVGGHAQLIVGYRPGAFKVLNSWGLGWGDGGYAWLDETFIAERAFDLTVVTAAPVEVL